MKSSGVAKSAMAMMIWGAALLPAAHAGSPYPAGIEPEVYDGLLFVAHAFKNADTLQVSAFTTSEEVSSTNEKVQLDSKMDLAIARPNKIHLEKSGYEDFSLWYDGTTITVLDRSAKKYARIPFQGGLTDVDDKLDEFGIETPLAGMFNDGLEEHLKKNVTQGRVLGSTEILGTECTHFGLRQSDIDWQVWLDKATKLPKKITLTSKTLTGSPEYQVTIKDLKFGAAISDDAFTFKAPDGAQEVPIKSFGEDANDDQQ